MFNKILMDEVLPYGLDNLLVTLILVFSMVSMTSHADRLCAAVGADPSVHQDRYPADAGLLRAHLPSAHEVLCHPQDGDITTRYSDANTIKSIFTSIALSLVMDISMAIITGIILFRMNAMLFSISLFMALVSILLVLVYKQPL